MQDGSLEPRASDVRLIVSDDLRRSRGTVFFRLWFALPFLIWLGVWAAAAFFVAIANWAATLAAGRSPRPLHGFLARFVRYATHVYAYLYLGAEPLPGFGGKPGYPIDVEIGPPARQGRWSVAFRIVLAIPALLLFSVIAGPDGGTFFSANQPETETEALRISSGSLLVAAAFLGWFYALARGRMARGLRDVIAYGLSYGAQLWAYLLLLTDRYPSSDPLTAIGALPTRDDPVQLRNRDDLRRSRLTTFFRLLLAVPHLVWLSLWGLVVLLAVFFNWFAILIVGVSPQSVHRFIAAYLRYQLHVGAYVYLVANPFPGFSGAEGTYPVELRVAGAVRQNRWTVLFRLPLALPALLIASAYGSLAFVVAVLGWFAALVTGRMPLGLRNAGALALRYLSQSYAYIFLATGAYPYSGPCLASPPPEASVPEAVPPPLAA